LLAAAGEAGAETNLHLKHEMDVVEEQQEVITYDLLLKRRLV